MPRTRAGRPAKPLTKAASSRNKARDRRSRAARPPVANGNPFPSRGARRAQARAKAADGVLSRDLKGKGRAVDDDADDGSLSRGPASDDEAVSVGSDDEELDSDQASTSGGEEAPSPSGSRHKKTRRPSDARGDDDAISLNENDPAVDEDESADLFVDASEMLDRGVDEDDDEDDDSASDDDATESSWSEGSDEEVHGFDDLVDSLPGFSKAPTEPDEALLPPPKRRKVIPERTEAGPENEFAAIGVRDQPKVTLEDMLVGLPPARAAELRRKLKFLAVTEPASAEPPKTILKSKGPLPAPLPGPLQAKVERRAANEQLGKELEGWNETLRQMKGIGPEGQAFGGNKLTLPLGSKTGPTTHVNGAEMLSTFKANTDMEKSVRAMLEAARVAPKTVVADEKAMLASLPPAEAAARVAEVRRQRELLFRAERKAKRLSKIKSKTYHRLQKRARVRAEQAGGLSLDEMAQLDEADGGDRARTMREKLETIRARERATLRHAPGASKWSQAVQGVEGLDENHQIALRDRAEQQERLRRRIIGLDDEDESDKDDGSLADDADETDIRAHAFDELAAFEAKESARAAGTRPSGLAAMPFMQKAELRERKMADDLEAQFRSELLERDGDESDAAVVAAGTPDAAQLLNGRRSFAPSKSLKQDSAAPDPGAPKVRKTATDGNIEIVLAPSAEPTFNPFALAAQDARKENQPPARTNPWLAVGEAESQRSLPELSNTPLEKNGKASQKAISKLEKRKRQTAEAKQAAAEEARVVIRAGAHTDDDDDEADEPVHIDKRRARFELQHDLVARAFAGDDVVTDFAQVKQAEIERDAPRDVDISLPGWGSWGGKGVRKSRRPPILKHLPGIDAKQRKDSKLPHVIISERRDRKSTKYLVKDLPHPYTSAAQREQALRQPLGKEFATATTNKAATKPQVMIRPGNLIQPVSKGQ